MTIGSSHNHPADIAATLQTAASLPWAARFPNPPDLCFDYRRLLEQPGGIARGGNAQHRICIIGAGVAGLVAARELLRCGFERITLIEQSRRLGGRHLTVHPDGPQSTAPSTPFEMGAMRMPFFNRTGEAPAQGRSLMAYYAGLYDLKTSDFPNPGTPFVRSTGIYLREGQLMGEGEPRLLVWNNPEGSTPPPTAALQAVYQKWKLFAERMATQVAAVFGSQAWPALWSAIVTRYQHVSFRELVRSAAITSWDPDNPGDFGGLGMSADESSIFYAIGIGDGSWGAFYDVCSLYPLRTAIFGFSSHLQLVHGRVDGQGNPLPAPFQGEQAVTDSKGVAFAAPRYLGLAALDECLMFMPLEEGVASPYERLRQQPAGLITDSPVNRLTRLADGSIEVGYRWHQSDALASRQMTEQFDSVIVTVPSWILETRIQVEGFTPAMLPQTTINAYKTAHWETSCKVYAPLKKTFLSAHRDIPQILVTDSFVHDVYAYRYNDNYAYDCILLSYTWEDDATKLAAFSDAELVDKCIRELDRILLRCSNVGSRISPFIDTANACVQRWVTDRNALGCAKLYRAGAYQDAVGLMSYNRDYSARSGLYLAGESFSVDAGWTEPAMRGAVDAVINLCANQGAAFNGGFDLSHYPRYGTES
ncbi:flavin monoamine oxidase family protein [Pseudomonas coleopterorum]|uniref:flavin monoamine oxidase family protein n=1 Tax=Pseudomonas coleopterorum TaxID=1605838 RepID=UPI0017817CA6|nr:FAD-dependent oxidoreductase [Pseudomonas coleopterorum]MBD8482912.1 FAD-dependent oxidoreductase [Pseudomonas coleopterorum]